MRKILNPRWLFLVNTLPMLFLCFMLYYSFTGIRTELDDNSLQQWFILAVGLGVLGIGDRKSVV